MKTIQGLKYFIYARKSSESEEKQVQSIERQLDILAEVIKSKNLEVVGSFQESRSAKIPNNRPQFELMIEAINKGHANGILCWHLNRLSRNPRESGEIQQLLCDDKILSIMTPEKEYMPEDNTIIFSVESGMASQYSRDLSKSVKSGMEKKVKMGIAPVKARIGYLNTKNQEHGSNYIIEDPVNFPIVRKVWDYMLTGKYTPRQILKIATDEWGLRTIKSKRKGDKPLSLSGMYRLFSDIFYTGLFNYHGIVHNGKHTAMITLTEYDKVQVLLGRSNRPRSKVHTFDYTGIMKCGECGSAITASEKQKVLKGTGELKTYIFYHCTKRKKGAENCSQNKWLPLSELEGLILKEVEKYTVSQSFKKFIFEYIKYTSTEVLAQEEAVKENQQKEISKLETEIKNLFQMRVSESIDDIEYQKERKIREQKLTLLKKQIQETEYSLNGFISRMAEKIGQFTDMKSRFEKKPESRKAIFLALGWNYELKDNKLFIYKHKWLNLMINFRDKVNAKINWLEPENSIEKYERKAIYDLLLPQWCALVKEVGTDSHIGNPELGDPPNFVILPKG